MQIALFIIGLIALIAFSIWLLKEPDFEPLTGFLGGLATLLVSLQPFAEDFEIWIAVPFVVLALLGVLVVAHKRKKGDAKRQPGETPIQHHRRMLINTVENWWIKGVLAKSLHGLAMMELGIKENPDAVNRAWSIRQESTGQLLPSDTGITQIFEQVGCGRSLLILGEPGAGKTTMLLDFARCLIRQARKDETKPIPLVLNLSTWRGKKPGIFGGVFGEGRQQTFEEWLNDQLQQFYKWSKPNLNQTFLLLDGLDEVSKSEKHSCVGAINQFRESYGLVPLAICCRKADYEAIGNQLDMEGAITLQPLVREQIDQYLIEAGEALRGVREILTEDETLYELLNTPLILSVMALAYQNSSPTELTVLPSTEDRRKHLFDTYINQMFRRLKLDRKMEELYSREKMENWLPFLAYNMCEQECMIFNHGELQPAWLQATHLGRLYSAIMVIAGSTAIGLFFVLCISPLAGSAVAIAMGLMSMRGAAIWQGEAPPAEFGIKIKDAKASIAGGLVGGLIGGLLGRPIGGLGIGLVGGLSGGLIFGPLGALGAGTNFVLNNGQGTGLRERVRGGVFGGLLGGLLVGLSGGLLGGLVGGLLGGLLGGLSTRLRERLLGGLRGGLVYGLIYGLIIGLSGGSMGGLFVGLLGGLIAGLIIGLVSSLVWGTSFRLFFKQISGLSSGLKGRLRLFEIRVRSLCSLLFLGLYSGLFLGLSWGIFASIQHYLLRIMLHQTHHLPWRLNLFLDYAADLVFMRKVGKDYEFVHALLRDHFADRYAESLGSGTR